MTAQKNETTEESKNLLHSCIFWSGWITFVEEQSKVLFTVWPSFLLEYFFIAQQLDAASCADEALLVE